MPDALKRLLHARIVGFLREPEAVFWTFGFPIIMAVALGIAFRNKPPEKIDVAVVEQGAAGEGLLGALTADTSLSPVLLTAPDAQQSLRTGKVALVVVPGDPIAYRFDQTRPESRVARLAVAAALERASGRPAIVSARDEHVTEPGSRYIDFLVPGLLGMNIMSASMWGIGWSIVEARGRKLLKRFAATPMPRAYYLASFMLAHLILVSALVVTVTVFARIAFDVRIFGSVLSFYAVTMFGAASFAGLGILLASRTESSETLSGLNNAAMMPMFVVSGVFFSSSHFPAIAQPIIKALPLTAMNEALRAIMTDGRPLLSLWPQLLVMAVWGTVSFVLALRWFRWT
ncbi:MAG TPA: ABC transporter permease [bacterium]|nr:ABC transporter permease [bacterium]